MPITLPCVSKPPYDWEVPHSWPLVGRREELEFVDRATNRSGTAGVLVAGAPGVGKTRLIRESLARTEISGRSTAWSQATRAGAGIPFGALAHLLPAGIAGAGRRNLLRIAADEIADLSPTGSLVLGIDDAHLLDDHSAALVHLLAETDRCTIVATLRSGEGVPDPITVLWKDELIERVELQPLSMEEVRALVAAALEPPVDARTMLQLWSVTRGNVLFLRELVLGGLESGRLEQVRGVWHWRGGFADVPRLSDVLDERLRSLGAEQRALLEVIATAEPIPVGVLEALDEARWLESAADSGLLDISGGRPSMVGISHPLYAEALRSSMMPTRRRTIYRALTDALLSDASPGDLLRVASWKLEIGDITDHDLFLDAAREALVRFDYDLAFRLATAAHDAGAGAGSLLIIAQSLDGQGLFERAEAVFAEAERSSPSETQRAAAATSRAFNLFWHLGRNLEARGVLDEARLAVTDATVGDELTAELGAYHVFGGDVQQGLALLEPLVARRTASGRALVLSAMTLTFALSISGRTRKARAVVDEILALARDVAGAVPFGPSWLSGNNYVSLMIEGRLDEALKLAEAAYDESITQGATILVGPHAHFLGWLTLAQGRVRTSLDWLRRAVDALEEVDYQRHMSATLGDIARAEALLGHVAAAEEALEHAESERVPSFLMDESFIGLGRVWTAVARGEISRGAEVAIATAQRVREAEQRYFEAACLHDAARLGMAAIVSPRLQELVGSFDGVLVRAYAHHADALACNDPIRLMGVCREFEEIGAMLFAAEAAAEASRIHRREGRKGSALVSASKARALADLCEGARTAALAHIDVDLPLTRREEEVASLAAGGLSNREIAERLVVSVRTVDNHLHSAYAKLGVSGRRELAPILLTSPSRSE
jgi:DNA-binding CsgD family transcriptional regulator